MHPPSKWHGGKHPIRNWVIGLIPAEWKRQHGQSDARHFVETHGGMGSVILNKQPCDIETFNDVDLSVWNLFHCLKHQPDEVARLLALTPYHEEEWRQSCITTCATGPQAAADLYARMRQSFGGAGKSFAVGKRSRTGMADSVSAWLASIDSNLPHVIERLRGIQHICRRDALDVIDTFDSINTCFYCDPPYMALTRASPNVYACEYTELDHHKLLEALAGVKGRFLLSGYRNDIYDWCASECGWDRFDLDVANHAAGGGSKRRMTECIWRNRV